MLCLNKSVVLGFDLPKYCTEKLKAMGRHSCKVLLFFKFLFFSFESAFVSRSHCSLVNPFQTYPEVDCFNKLPINCIDFTDSLTKEREKKRVIRQWSWESMLTHQQADGHKTLYNAPLKNKKVLRSFFLFLIMLSISQPSDHSQNEI